MFLNTVTVKTKIFPLFISQIPRVNLAEVGSNTVRDVKQRILLVDLGGMLWLYGAFECGGIDGKLGGLTPMNSYPRLVCIHGIKITVLSRLR